MAAVWEIKNIIDLSLPLTANTPVYPGDPLPRITRAATLKKEGYNLHQLEMATHSGTHIDAPFHMLAGGLTLDRLDPSLFAARGVIIPVTGKLPGEEITIEDLAGNKNSLSPGTAVLFHTGWDKKIGSRHYYQHPCLSTAACRYLLDRKIRTFGTDAMGLDSPTSTDFPVHKMIAAAEGVIIENLSHLDQVTFPHPLVLCLPLPLEGTDGSPVRAVALEITTGDTMLNCNCFGDIPACRPR